jgi:YHS domain-containing protein
MGSILWFLIIGVLFFFMMRFGCGAHMGGGHMGHMGGHEPEGGPPGTSQKVKDPVCGMEIDKDQAFGMTQKWGKQIYFCSENCQNKFNTEPKQYL